MIPKAQTSIHNKMAHTLTWKINGELNEESNEETSGLVLFNTWWRVTDLCHGQLNVQISNGLRGEFNEREERNT